VAVSAPDDVPLAIRWGCRNGAPLGDRILQRRAPTRCRKATSIALGRTLPLGLSGMSSAAEPNSRAASPAFSVPANRSEDRRRAGPQNPPGPHRVEIGSASAGAADGGSTCRRNLLICLLDSLGQRGKGVRRRGRHQHGRRGTDGTRSRLDFRAPRVSRPGQQQNTDSKPAFGRLCPCVRRHPTPHARSLRGGGALRPRARSG
jgi:hypothetical protein